MNAFGIICWYGMVIAVKWFSEEDCGWQWEIETLGLDGIDGEF